MLANRVILNFDAPLLKRIDAEKERTGATRNGTVIRILEKHFEEQQEKQKLYDAWFIAEVERGMKSAQTEPLIDHADVIQQVRTTIAKAKAKHASKVV